MKRFFKIHQVNKAYKGFRKKAKISLLKEKPSLSAIILQANIMLVKLASINDERIPTVSRFIEALYANDVNRALKLVS